MYLKVINIYSAKIYIPKYLSVNVKGILVKKILYKILLPILTVVICMVLSEFMYVFKCKNLIVLA